MAIQKKYIFGGLAAIVAVTGTLAYLQYRKIMNYDFKVAGVKIRKISASIISFDLIINFINKSNISITIMEVITKVYVNNKFAADVVNKIPFTILANSTSPISTNISFNPANAISLLGSNLLNLVSNTQNVNIRADIQMKAKLWFFTVTIPYTYNTTLAELTAPSPVVSQV